MDWLTWVQLGLAIAALAVSLIVLGVAAHQVYLDRVAAWPYETPFIGRLKNPIGPWMVDLAFRFGNRTSSEAFFEVRYTPEGDTQHFLPRHMSVWPSQERVGYWVAVPPKASREIRVSPFDPPSVPMPSRWTLTIIEYRHRDLPVVLRWPEDLDKPVDMLATDIPPPTSG